MKRLMTAVVALLATLAANASTTLPVQGTIVPADNANIQYVGRICFQNPKQPRFTFPGVQINARFTGTSLRMMAKPKSGYFMVQIDEAEPFKVSFMGERDSVATLATALQRGEHTVRMMYVIEGYELKPDFRGFVLDEGASLLPPPALPERTIEFIGNSITCGYGIEANSEAEHYDEKTANYYYTYAARTARALNAQAVVIARSGIGVYRSYNGPKTGDIVNMNTEYPNTLLYNDKVAWDFSRYTPDLVCINLGTNDTSTQGADSVLLLQGFKRLYQQVRSHYPKAKILLLSGCMMNGQQLQSAKCALDATADYAHNQGDAEVYRFDFTPHDGSLGYGADWHPSMRQHEKMANELIPYLQKLMNW